MLQQQQQLLSDEDKNQQMLMIMPPDMLDFLSHRKRRLLEGKSDDITRMFVIGQRSEVEKMIERHSNSISWDSVLNLLCTGHPKTNDDNNILPLVIYIYVMMDDIKGIHFSITMTVIKDSFENMMKSRHTVKELYERMLY